LHPLPRSQQATALPERRRYSARRVSRPGGAGGPAYEARHNLGSRLSLRI